MTAITTPRPWTGALTEEQPATRRAVFALAAVFVAAIPLTSAVTIASIGTLGKVAGIVFAAPGLALILARGARVRLHGAHLVLIAFVAWASASLLWSIEPTESSRHVLTLIALLVMMLLLWEFAPERRDVLALMEAYVLGAYVPVAVLLWTAATNPIELNRYTVSDTHPNSIAFVLALGIPLACYLSAEGSRRWPLLHRLYPVGAIAGILLTASRSALVTGAVAALMLPVVLRGLSRPRRVAGVALVVAVAVLAAGTFPGRPLERLATFDAEIASGTLNGRTMTWVQSAEIWSEHPVGGVGIGAARYALLDARGREGGVHNTFLSVAVDLGAVGLLLFLLVLILALAQGLRTRGLDRRLVLVLAATLAVGLVPRHWEYERPTWLVVALVLGLGATASHTTDEPRGA